MEKSSILFVGLDGPPQRVGSIEGLGVTVRGPCHGCLGTRVQNAWLCGPSSLIS
jgi:hypothetical protein